jgi:hypothetical protein
MLDQQAARIAELEGEVKRAEEEAEHYAKLAVVDGDLGRNPPVFWKDRAEKAEAERDAAQARVKLLDDYVHTHNVMVANANRAAILDWVSERERELWCAGRDAAADCIEHACHDDMDRDEEAAAIRALTPPGPKP